jgi:hypothetical protein
LTLPVAEGFLRLSFAAAQREKNRRILRLFIKSRVDFLFASGIKEVLEDNASSKAASHRPRVASEEKSGLSFHDSRDRATAKCLGVYAANEAASIGAAAGGAQKTTERPGTPAAVARATGRPSGRVGRLPGDSALPVSTAAAIVTRAKVFCLFQRRTIRSPVLGASLYLLHRRVVSIVDIVNVLHGAFAAYGRHAYSRAFSGA